MISSEDGFQNIGSLSRSMLCKHRTPSKTRTMEDEFSATMAAEAYLPSDRICPGTILLASVSEKPMRMLNVAA
jgi:hypothetical protein